MRKIRMFNYLNVGVYIAKGTKETLYELKAKKLIFVSFLLFSVIICTAKNPIIIDKEAIARNLEVVSPATTGVGIPATNRLVWDSIAKLEFAKRVLSSAEPYLTKPFPQWNDSVYKLYYVTGAREHSDAMMSERKHLLPLLTFAECIENQGRFIPVIEKVIESFCDQPTWTLAAHDKNLDNFKGIYGIDLNAATLANQFGQALHLIGHKLNTNIKNQALHNLEKRIFAPVVKSLENPEGQQWWLNTTNNWSAVCVSGITAAALATQTDANKRAFYVTFGQQLIKNFIDGFLDDGYCVEGIGYFSYGFGNFLLLRETLLNATNGQIDLLNNPKVARIANYPLKSEIINGIYPSIGDCRTGTKPAEWIMHHLHKNYLWNIPEYASSPSIIGFDLMSDLIQLFGNYTKITEYSNAESGNSIRSFFPGIGLLYARPRNQSDKNQLAIAIMGGNNGFSHNHNDIGTYNIVCGNELLMGDMGGPKGYTSKTFTAERYSLYKMFSSFGHPVPLVDGVEQHESLNAKGIVIDSLFSENRDKIAYDLKSGYKCDKLKSLTRTMNYNRKQSTVITVTDEFSAISPIAFETALTTRAMVSIIGNKLYLSSTTNKLEVSIDSSTPYTIQQTQIADHGIQAFTRIAIVFKNKENKGKIAVRYKSVAMSEN